MKMTLPQLSRVARNVLKVMREHNLNSVEALVAVADEPLDPEADDRYAGEEYVIVRRHGPTRVSLDYFRRTGQTPLLFIVSAESVKAMLTAEEVLDGYDPFERTDDDDYMQDRRLGPADLSLVRAELERLAALATPAG